MHINTLFLSKWGISEAFNNNVELKDFRQLIFPKYIQFKLI